MDDRELSGRLQKIEDMLIELRGAVGLIPTAKITKNRRVTHNELQ